MMGSGEALDKVAATPGKDSDLWFEFACAEKGPDEGKSIRVVTGTDAAKGNVHRYVELTCAVSSSACSAT
jgi:hypothetical protein